MLFVAVMGFSNLNVTMCREMPGRDDQNLVGSVAGGDCNGAPVPLCPAGDGERDIARAGGEVKHGHRAIQPYAQLAPDLLQRGPFAQASHVDPVDAHAGGDQVAARVVIQVRDQREQQHDRGG